MDTSSAVPKATEKRTGGKKRPAKKQSASAAAPPAAPGKAVSNWEKLKRKIDTPAEVPSNGHRRKKHRMELTEAAERADILAARKAKKKPVFDINADDDSLVDKSKYVALDCEMVGLGENGKTSALARCAIVDYDGAVVYDEFVRPPGYVTDFRTKYSGIRKKDLRRDNAISLQECQAQVADILKGKILVGHALKNDLDVLMLKHARHSIRDTATFKPYMRPHGRKGGKFKPRSLKDLTKQFLGYEIQSGEHDPSEDARAPMMLYRFKRIEWEKSLATAGRKKRPDAPEKKSSKPDPEVNGAIAVVVNKPSQMFKS